LVGPGTSSPAAPRRGFEQALAAVAKPGDVTMSMLASTLHDDFQLSVETAGALESFNAIGAETLLLGGSNSPAYFGVALDALEDVLPNATRIEFSGLNHAQGTPTEAASRSASHTNCEDSSPSPTGMRDANLIDDVRSAAERSAPGSVGTWAGPQTTK
jgi:hypothetical protein